MTFDQHLGDLAPHPAIAELLRDLRARRRVRCTPKGGYLDVNPDPLGAIAVTAHRTRVEIATEPHRAQAVCAGIPGARLRPRTRATTTVVLDAAVVAAEYERVREEALTAVDWRTEGPAWTADSRTRAGTAAVQPAPVCPRCRLALPRSGACDCS